MEVCKINSAAHIGIHICQEVIADMAVYATKHILSPHSHSPGPAHGVPCLSRHDTHSVKIVGMLAVASADRISVSVQHGVPNGPSLRQLKKQNLFQILHIEISCKNILIAALGTPEYVLILSIYVHIYGISQGCCKSSRAVARSIGSRRKHLVMRSVTSAISPGLHMHPESRMHFWNGL